MSLRIRDDDIGLPGTDIDKLKKVHETLCSVSGLIHIPTIIGCGLDKELNKFLREEYEEGRLIPEVHGWEHIDYGKLPAKEIEKHLKLTIEAVTEATGYTPTKFYTPWGANTPEIQRAATGARLEVVDCSDIHQLRKMGPALRSRHYEEYCKSYKDHGELMIHFWEGFCWKTPEKMIRYLECVIKEEKLV